MARRVRLAEDGGSFFETPTKIETFPTGSTLLDLVLGGGWVVGGVINLVGDRSTNKTGTVTEAMANYHRAFPEAPIRYTDAENAYDKGYATALGCPEDVEPYRDCSTVESFAKDFDAWAKAIPDGGRGFYALDSLDSLSDQAEMDREVGEASYGMAKAKLLSEFFRRTANTIGKKKITLLVVSQIRTAIGVSWGDKTTRAGGKALDFYALQIVRLKHTGRIKVKRGGVEKVVGVSIEAKCEKNKIAKPFEECAYPVIFDFGIDDVASMAAWLAEVNRLPEGVTLAELKSLSSKSLKMPTDEWRDWRKKLRKATKAVWREIAEDFAQTKRKYE